MVANVKYLEIQSKRKKCHNMDSLFDELLVEIFSRLPCHTTVAICKAVCKHWAALLSQRFFISRFVANKVSKNTAPYGGLEDFSEYDEPRMKITNDRTFGLVVRRYYRNSWEGLMIRLNDPINNPKNISISSLPRLLTNGGLPRNLTVVGACNDLLLYKKHGDDIPRDELKLYICNAQTRQLIALPSLPLLPTHRIGLICEPYYSSQTNYLTLNDAYRACIVVIPSEEQCVVELPAYFLSPNTGGMWCNVTLSLPTRCSTDIDYCGLFCIGKKLYFHSVDCIVGFDPFVDSDVIRCHSLPKPPCMYIMSTFFGMFHERLYACDRENNGRYRIWVLDDYETGQWSLQHSIQGKEWIPRQVCLSRYLKRNPCFGDIIGFHPTNPDVLYVICPRWIVLCNLSTQKMTIASKLPKRFQWSFPCTKSYEIALPAWPTPLPSHRTNL